jgi:phosphoglycerate dehydrogenase-like enzyme
MTTGPVVVVADANLAALHAEFEAALPDGSEVRRPSPRDIPAIEAAVSDADVLVSGSCPPAVGAAGKRLRLLHAGGAGTDGIDVTALPPGVPVANTFHHEDSIAEHVVAASILLRRRFLQQDAALRRGVGNTAAPSRLPFDALPNVLMTPHSSGLTRQTFAGRAADIAANIRRLVAGEPLRNVVAVAR